MILGVNFEPAAGAPLGYEVEAVRALRPAVVRHVLLDWQNGLAWASSARRSCVRVLWTIPSDVIGVPAARHALRELVVGAADVTAGYEIGLAPWQYLDPRAHLVAAYRLAEHVPHNPNVPVILGTGYNRARQAERWLAGLVAAAPPRSRMFDAVSVHCVDQSWAVPLGGLSWALAADRIRRAFDVPLAVTRAGWPLESRLGLVARAIETVATGQPTRVLTAPARRRWLFRLLGWAAALEATHVLLEADGSPGAPRWSLYDRESGLADHLWPACRWRVSGLERRRAAA